MDAAAGVISPLDYAARGWQVFPCYTISQRGICTCKDGEKCPSPGKHPIPLNGFKAASTDLSMIRGWMARVPDANWAVRTGPASGLTVLDLDFDHGGIQSFTEFQKTRGAMPETLRSWTGGGGRHLLYQHPQGVVIPSSKGWLPGVDIRSDGGYVVLPYSRHLSGGQYQWLNWWYQPTPLPQDIATMLLNRASAASNGMTGGDLADTDTVLQGVPEGERDDTLFRVACRLRRQLGDDAKAAVQILIGRAAANCLPPFPHDQAMRKVEQAWAQDHTELVVDWQMGKPRDHHPLTDLGNAYRLYDAYGKDMLYVSGWGWMVGTDTGWHVDTHSIVSERSYQLSNMILTEARELEQQGTDLKAVTKHMVWAHRSQSRATMDNAVVVARGLPKLRKIVDEFDCNDYEICCQDRIVDLRTGSDRPITRDDLVTKNTHVEYDPNFLLPEWNWFLWETFNGDVDLISYLQRAAGYTITGSNKEEKLFLNSGPPASGKSTFLDSLHSAFGSYATSTSPDTFMWSRTSNQPLPELARMAGMRMVSMSEIREGAGFNENLIKGITGGDPITAKPLYQSPFTYRPKFKVWIGTNHDPAAYDDGMWRRVAKIPFPNALPPERRDLSLKLKLRDPDLGGKAVLAWAVAGAVEWYQKGLMQPYAVTAATWEYNAEQDQFQQFINACIRQVPGARTALQDAFLAYRAWCVQAALEPAKRPLFTRKMRDRGFKVDLDDSGQESYPGIIVTSPISNNMYQ